MSRRREAEKRDIVPDIKYNSVLIAKLINKLMQRGKKSLAEKIVYSAFDLLEKKHNVQGHNAFERALENVRPYLIVKPIRIGGANYQVPVSVEESKAHMLALGWMIEASKKRPEKSMEEKLAHEFWDASNNHGISVKKKEDTHKMAEANRAFAHFNVRKN